VQYSNVYAENVISIYIRMLVFTWR